MPIPGTSISTHQYYCHGGMIVNNSNSVDQDVKQHVCPYCGHRFHLKVHMKQHVRSVHEKVSYPCDKCDKKYSCPGSLYKHTKKNHCS